MSQRFLYRVYHIANHKKWLVFFLLQTKKYRFIFTMYLIGINFREFRGF